MKAGKFRVSMELLKNVLSLPDDIVILGIEAIPQDQAFLIYAASSVFPEVLEGSLLTGELNAIVHAEWCEHGGIIKRWIEWTK